MSFITYPAVNSLPTAAKIAVVQGINPGGLLSIFGDGTMGRAMQVGVCQNTTDGDPAQPSLQLSNPGMWRFRAVLKAGSRTISVNVKQAANITPYPSMIIKANPAMGVNSDVATASSGGTGWVTIGPVSVTVSTTGATWVELWANSWQFGNSPVLFDHIVIT